MATNCNHSECVAARRRKPVTTRITVPEGVPFTITVNDIDGQQIEGIVRDGVVMVWTAS